MTSDVALTAPAHDVAPAATKLFILRDVAVAAALWLPGCLIFFRSAFLSGFDQINGNSGDARLMIYGHEHWVQVLRGHVSWRSPEFFFPTKGVLGYSDTFLLNEVFYLPLRAAGLDPFLAFEWTLVLMSLVGFLGIFVLLRRLFGLGVASAAALSTAFVFANNLYVKSGHLQLYSIYWIPVVLLLIAASVRATSRRDAIAWASAAGALLGLLFYSTFYIPWFAALSAVIFGVVFTVLRLSSVGRTPIRNYIRERLWAASAFVVAFALAMIPFVITYLPVLRTSGGRTYEDAMLYAARPSDMVNVSNTNYVWGAVMRASLSEERLRNIEVSLATTPIMVVAAVASAVVVWLISRRIAREKLLLRDVCTACAVTLIALIVLPVKFSWGSLWRIPWTVVPGAVGIRAIDRVALLGGLFAVGAIGCALRALALHHVGNLRQRWMSVAVPVVLALLVVEQFNTVESSLVDRSDEVKALVVAPAPPAECASFFITDSAPGSVPGYASNIDAMLISQHFDIPTVSGYSGQFPENFVFLDPGSPGHDEQVRAWAAANGVGERLCSYDRTALVWVAPPGVGSEKAP